MGRERVDDVFEEATLKAGNDMAARQSAFEDFSAAFSFGFT